MADEAFALSPISARAALPSEADYEAIREAFMETSRGRWFLSEYTRRNRNADTHMVLDAVARIEHSIAAQKQAPGHGLIESLGAIRTIVQQAKAATAQALDSMDRHSTLVAARDAARIIREVATTLRECGADVRICDLLDTQLAAIDSGHREIAAIAQRDAVLASFDQLMLRIADLAAADTPVAPAQSDPQPQPAAAAVAEPQSPIIASAGRAAPTADAAAAPPVIPSPAAATSGSPSEATPQETAATDDSERGDAAEFDAEEALDFAVLDLVASEMAEPDPEEFDPADYAPDISDMDTTASAVVDDVATRLTPAPQTPPVPRAPISEPAAEPAASLGAALLAGGLVQRPMAAGPDPLAPIRRFSQAERIAFFS